MTISQQHASKNGCFSNVLHRFLCSGGLPTHPSSDVDSPKEEPPIRPPSPTRNTTPPGVIARLMGLDSFPNSPKRTNTIMQKSRSLGSLDFLPNFNITKQPLYHRRVTSFRENIATTFFHDLGKSDVGLTPIQEKIDNLRERVELDTNMKSNNKKKKKNIIKKQKSQSQSQSVKVKNEEEEGCSVPLKVRRKMGVNGGKKTLVDGFRDEQKKYKSRSKTYNHPLPKMGKHGRRKEKKKSMLKRKECEYNVDYCIKVLKEVCRLTIVEIEGGVWVDTKVVENYNIQEVSYEIGQQILQFLMYEMVDDLCSSH